MDGDLLSAIEHAQKKVNTADNAVSESSGQAIVEALDAVLDAVIVLANKL